MSQELMNRILMIVIILLVVAIVIVVAYVVYRYVRKSKDPAYAEKLKRNAAYREALTPAKTALKKAQKEYDARLQARQDAIKSAEADHQRNIKAQEKEVARVEDQYSSSVQSFQGVKLFRDRAEYKGKMLRLATTAHAEVLMPDEYLATQKAAQIEAAADAQLEDINATPPLSSTSASSARSNGKALATTGSRKNGEMLKTSAAVSTAGAYLIIRDSKASNTEFKVLLDEKDVIDAKSFAHTFNCAAADIDTLRAKRSEQLDAAKARLKEIVDDTSAIEAAKVAYKEETKRRDALDAAQKAFDEAKYQATKMRDGLS